MAIDPLVVDNRPGLLNNSRPDNVNQQQQSILDRVRESNEEDDKKSSEKESEQRSDRVSLSQNALEIISNREGAEANNERNFDPVANAVAEQQRISEQRSAPPEGFAARLERTNEVAVEIIGIERIAQERDLSESESLRSQSLRSELSDLLENSEFSGTEVSEIAARAIDDARNEVVPVLAKISSGGEITGEEFTRLNDANELINKSNGFGIEGFNDISLADQQKSEDLQKQSDSLLERTEGRNLSQNELDYLQRLQTQISEIQGYKINIKDTVGPEGVVI